MRKDVEEKNFSEAADTDGRHAIRTVLLTDQRLSDPFHKLLQELPTADEGADALLRVPGQRTP